MKRLGFIIRAWLGFFWRRWIWLVTVPFKVLPMLIKLLFLEWESKQIAKLMYGSVCGWFDKYERQYLGFESKLANKPVDNFYKPYKPLMLSESDKERIEEEWVDGTREIIDYQVECSPSSFFAGCNLYYFTIEGH